MDLDPQKFYIGVMEFFTVLLPGALLTFLLMRDVGPLVFGHDYAALTDVVGWAVFFFASYLLGHLVFLLGALLDGPYDGLRRRTLNWQIARVARRGRALAWPLRVLVWAVFKRERDLAVLNASRLRRRALGPLQAGGAINTFQWCKTFLNVESPVSLAVVHRFEADSKFFRSFATVLLLVLAAWPLQTRWPAVGAVPVAVLLVLALWRYMEQRLKATNQAYWSVLTLAARAGNTLEPEAREPDQPPGAGGVVCRRRGRWLQFLLVEAKGRPGVWVLPQGHAEPREDPRETAVREVYEEAGVWAAVGVRRPWWRRRGNDHERMTHLGDALLPDGPSVSATRFYLMDAVARGRRKDKDWGLVWLPLERAIERASHQEARDLLRTAAQRRGAIENLDGRAAAKISAPRGHLDVGAGSPASSSGRTTP